VWVAEQQQAAEQQKTKDLARQIQQEREQDELDKIAGKTATRLDRGIDWMYTDQSANSEIAQANAAAQQEEYLLGKEVVAAAASGSAAGAQKSDLDVGRDNEGVNAAVAAAAAAREAPVVAAAAAAASQTAEPSVAEKNEAFRMRHEDPMFLVSMAAREKKAQAIHKRELYEKVLGAPAATATATAVVDGEADRKRRKKERKRERKSHKHKHRSNDDHDEQKRRKHRHRSRSQDTSEDQRHSSNRRSRSRSHERDRHHERDSRRHDDHYERHASHRREQSQSRSRSRERDDYRRRDHGEDDRRRERTHHKEDRYSEPERRHDDRKHRPDYGRNEKDEPSLGKKPGYGLQGGSSSIRIQPGELGPNQEILRKKREARDVERKRVQVSASSRRRMTPEERAATLREMETDAQHRHAARERLSSAKQDEKAPFSADRGDGSFLLAMRQETHGVRDGNMSMSERLAQNRHTNQKSHESFL